MYIYMYIHNMCILNTIICMYIYVMHTWLKFNNLREHVIYLLYLPFNHFAVKNMQYTT